MEINDKETQKVFQGQVSKKLPREIQQLAYRKLRMIAAATELNTFKILPGNRFEKLKGDRSHLYSIRIIKQWRITFEWDDAGKASNPMIEDYH